MQKENISQLLDETHKTLINWLQANENKEKWETGPEGKWTTGQHALHLLQSIKPLNNALSLPKFILKFKFGKANREVRDFNTVADRYNKRLKDSQGKTFKGSKNMSVPTENDKAYILNRLETESKKLQAKTLRWTNKDLDTYILPHPLMGKMPVRELLMWTSHHVKHHTQTLQEKY
jgi:hypothetical protein